MRGCKQTHCMYTEALHITCPMLARVTTRRATIIVLVMPSYIIEPVVLYFLEIGLHVLLPCHNFSMSAEKILYIHS